MPNLATDLTLYESLNKIAARFPRRRAVTFGGETLTDVMSQLQELEPVLRRRMLRRHLTNRHRGPLLPVQ